MKIKSVSHSGNLGDILYSLPALHRAFYKDPMGLKFVYYIKLDRPSTFTDAQHPLGSVMMNRKMFDMAYPLLKAQPYIHEVIALEKGEDMRVDYDLDLFRKEYKNLSAGNIQTWISMVYPELRPNLHRPSLFADPKPNDYILVSRSSRYQNQWIDYSLLKHYDNVKFIGVEGEFKALRLHNPNIEHLEVKDFLELAELIAGCRLYIGNQSMPYAIAELLKVKRILEQFAHAPNVIPSGGEWYAFHTNEQFKKLLNKVLSSPHGKGENSNTTETQTDKR